jgi:hypothetical protein
VVDLLSTGELRKFFRRGREAHGKQERSGRKSFQLELPDGGEWYDVRTDTGDVDWFVWRLVTKRIASLHDLETTWSHDDAVVAHDVLTALDTAEARMRERQERTT